MSWYNSSNAAIKNPVIDINAALKPNLFIIGASKSGSSALHAYLRPHPQISMSTEKEPCFFVDNDELKESWSIAARQPFSHDWSSYLALWEGGEAATFRGEASVYYSQYPHRSGVAARIAEACPNAKIVYTVREPVGRAIAHFWQRTKEFQEHLPIEQAVRENAIYRDTSDYALQLSEYLKYFDRSQIYIVTAEELRAERRATLENLTDWLGLSPYEYSDAEITVRHASPPTSRRERFPFVASVRNSKPWAVTRNYLPTFLIDRIRQSTTQTYDKSDVDETDASAWLAEYLSSKREAFEEIYGRKVSRWPTLS